MCLRAITRKEPPGPFSKSEELVMTWVEALQVGTVVVASLGGGGTIVLGLSGFLGRIWAERFKGEIEAGLRQLDAALRHHTFLQQRFADLELEAIAQCWRAARACLPLINATRPHDSGTDREVLQANVNRLSDAHNALIEAVGRHEPFLPAAMVETLDAIGRVLRSELSHIRYHPAFEGNWWEDGELKRREFAEHCDALLVQVRTRTAELRAEAQAEGARR
jgi:hypothetical protein